MNGKDGIKLSVGAMVIYIALGCCMTWNGNHNYATMFFIGTLIWAGSIFTWHKVKDRDEGERKS